MAQDTPRPVGRPQKLEADRLVPVTVRIPVDDYEFICRAAMRMGRKPSEIVRELLQHGANPR